MPERFEQSSPDKQNTHSWVIKELSFYCKRLHEVPQFVGQSLRPKIVLVRELSLLSSQIAFGNLSFRKK